MQQHITSYPCGLVALLTYCHELLKSFHLFFFFQIPFCPSASFWEHGMTQNITLRGEIARPSAFTSILSNVLGDNAGSWMIEVTWKWMSLVNCKKRVFTVLIVICTFLLISGLIKKQNCQAIRRCHISSNIGGRKILLSEQNRAGIRETASKEMRRILILFLLLFLLLVVVVVVVVVVVFFHKFPPKEVDRVLSKVFK